MGKNPKKNTKKNKKPHDHDLMKKEFSKAYDLHIQGQFDQAEPLYKMIVSKHPKHSDALHLLGLIAFERKDHDKALSLIKRAITVYPQAAPYYNNLGSVYREKGQREEAMEAYRKALEIDPNYSEAHNNLGTLLKDKIDLAGAVSCFERATRINTGFSTAYYNLGTVLCDQARIPASLVAYKKALDINPGFVEAHSNYLYTLHFSDSHSPEDIFKEHVKWGESLSIKDMAPSLFDDRDNKFDRPLNVGYVSPDFCTHSVAFFIEEVLSNHNRRNVTVFCYSNTHKNDDFTQRFKELSDHWRDIRLLSDHEAAELIRKDKIDVLVDLAGHTRNNRILIFAMKPAPVQVTWLGYPDTTGLPAMDYRLTDAVADPDGEPDLRHSETLYRMPHGFLCYRPAGEFYPVSALPMLSESGVTFGSFNNNAKISPSVIRAWALILKQVPGSRLKLKALSLTDFGTRKFLLEGFQSHGIPSDRVWFEGYRVTLKEHFLLYNLVDIALDTFPYNGTTTTCEALWMGVPVICLSGNSHVSRVGNSILTHLELQDLLADSVENYVEKAVALAQDQKRLQALRSGLRSRMIDSPLMDPAGFTADLENAYRAMWQKWAEKSAVQEKNRGEGGKEKKQDFFEKNLQALKTYHPHAERLLNEPAPFDFEVLDSPHGVPNGLVTNPRGDSTLMYCENELTGDTGGKKNDINHIKGKVLCVMGAGLFIHARSILDRVGQTNIVVFFEAIPALFHAALESFDLTPVLSHPNARLAVGDSADPYTLFEERDKLFTSDEGVFISYDRVVALAPEWYQAKRTLFEQFLTRRRISKDTVALSGRSFLENTFNNLTALSQSRPLNILDNVYKDVPAIVVAAGPSLSKNIHELKGLKDKVLIVAADSALAPLMDQDIKPHMVATIDNNDFTFEKLAPFIDELRDIDVLYAPTVTPKIVNGIRFRNSYYSFPDKPIQDLFNHLLGQNGTAMENIHSVIHLAIAAAQTAGCNPIVFIGLDLALSGTQDHANHTILNWGNNADNLSGRILVQGNDTDTVTSLEGLVSIKEICEQMIRSVPDRTYINSTQGGAKIDGTMVCDLAEAVTGFGSQAKEFTVIPTEKQAIVTKEEVVQKLTRLQKDIGKVRNHLASYENHQHTIETFAKNRSPKAMDPAALPDKIIRCIRQMDKINHMLEKDPLMSYIKGLLVEYHDEYKQYEIAASESFQTAGEQLISSLKQQSFVQKAREKALHSFDRILSRQVEFFSQWIHWIKTLNDHPNSMETIKAYAEFLYSYERWVPLEDLNHSFPDMPGKEWYQACVAMKRGDVSSGLSLFNQICEKDNQLKQSVNSFIDSMISEWLHVRGPDIYKQLARDRVILCDPSHEAVLISQDFAINKALEYCKKRAFSEACSVLMSVGGYSGYQHHKVTFLLGFLLISDGQVTKGRRLIQTMAQTEHKEDRKIVLKYLDIMFKPFKEESWFKTLVKDAETEIWARQICQELWAVSNSHLQRKLINAMVFPSVLGPVEEVLSEWEPLKHLLPEWHTYEAYLKKAGGSVKHALMSMASAKKVEEAKGTVCFGDEGWLDIAEAIMHLADGNYEAAWENLNIGLNKQVKPHAVLASAFICFWTGNEPEGRKRLETLLHMDNTPPWIARLNDKDLSRDGCVITDNRDGLNPNAAWNLLCGKLMVEEGMDQGWNGLKGAFLVEDRLLTRPKFSRAMDLVLGKWASDSDKTMLYLSDGDVLNAGQILDSWEALSNRLPLSGFYHLKVECLMKEESTESALSYLDRVIKDLEISPRSYLDAYYVFEELGDGFCRAKSHNQALFCFEQAMMARPEDKHILVKIGDVYEMSGNLPSARVAYQTFCDAEPQNDEVRKKLDRLIQRQALP